MNLLDVKALTAGYGSRTIIDGLDFKLSDNEVVAIIGGNGSGKSTFFKTFFGHADIQSVRYIKILEERLSGKDRQVAIKKYISYVPQKNNVFRALTIEENLSLATGRAFSGSAASAALDFIFEYTPALKKYFKKPASLLSGGERQQLAIGMSLLKKPRILLLDEPLAGLDPKAIENVKLLISAVSRADRLSIVIIEHRFMALQNIVSRLTGFRNGTIAGQIGTSGLLEEQLKAFAEMVFFGNSFFENDFFENDKD